MLTTKRIEITLVQSYNPQEFRGVVLMNMIMLKEVLREKLQSDILNDGKSKGVLGTGIDVSKLSVLLGWIHLECISFNYPMTRGCREQEQLLVNLFEQAGRVQQQGDCVIVVTPRSFVC